MEIKVGVHGDVTLLTLNGDLVAGTAKSLTDKVRKLLEKKFSSLVIVMKEVSFMDSTGLGACMSVYKAVKAEKGSLVFAEISKPVEDVLRITQADKRFLIAPDKTEAMKIINNVAPE